MPRAILAIRRYPLAILMAAILFLCSLMLASGSIGKINSGGDEGSGIGGTGRSGEFGGSGFGGTGSSNPFFGASDEGTNPDIRDFDGNDLPDESLPGSRPESETAHLPDLMPSLSELSRMLGEPVLEREILPPEPKLESMPEAPRLSQPSRALVDSSEQIAEPALIESADKPALEAVDSLIELPQLQQQFQLAELPSAEQSSEQNGEDLLRELAEQQREQTEETHQSTELAGDTDSEEIRSRVEERASPERIQRPELPPFQRMRPVERASISVPRPAPMRI